MKSTLMTAIQTHVATLQPVKISSMITTANVALTGWAKTVNW